MNGSHNIGDSLVGERNYAVVMARHFRSALGRKVPLIQARETTGLPVNFIIQIAGGPVIPCVVETYTGN